MQKALSILDLFLAKSLELSVLTILICCQALVVSAIWKDFVERTSPAPHVSTPAFAGLLLISEILHPRSILKDCPTSPGQAAVRLHALAMPKIESLATLWVAACIINFLMSLRG